jgi:hypothetical protein
MRGKVSGCFKTHWQTFPLGFFYQNTMTKPTSTILKPNTVSPSPINRAGPVFTFIVLFLYLFLYEIPISTFNSFKNRNRDKYLRQLVDEKFEQLENAKCLMLTQYFECNNAKLFSILETVEFNGKEFKLISLQSGARIETEGVCFWKGEITRCYYVPNTSDLNGGSERRFHI